MMREDGGRVAASLGAQGVWGEFWEGEEGVGIYGGQGGGVRQAAAMNVGRRGGLLWRGFVGCTGEGVHLSVPLGLLPHAQVTIISLGGESRWSWFEYSLVFGELFWG